MKNQNNRRGLFATVYSLLRKYPLAQIAIVIIQTTWFPLIINIFFKWFFYKVDSNGSFTSEFTWYGMLLTLVIYIPSIIFASKGFSANAEIAEWEKEKDSYKESINVLNNLLSSFQAVGKKKTSVVLDYVANTKKNKCLLQK